MYRREIKMAQQDLVISTNLEIFLRLGSWTGIIRNVPLSAVLSQKSEPRLDFDNQLFTANKFLKTITKQNKQCVLLQIS